MGISPQLWGPSTWNFLHLSVLAEPDDFDKGRLILYKQLYTLLQELLPCEKCRLHLKDNMKHLKNIESLKTKRELFDWTTELHNRVNKINNKPIYSYDSAFKLWDDIGKEKISLHTPNPVWKYISISLGMAILMYISYRLIYREIKKREKA